jgi:hypothetical protein
MRQYFDALHSYNGARASRTTERLKQNSPLQVDNEANGALILHLLGSCDFKRAIVVRGQPAA